MGAAAAAENPADTNNATMNSIKDTTIVVSEDAGGAEQLLGASNDENLSSADTSTFKQLNETINNIADNETITLSGNYIYDASGDADFKRGIVISHNNITIDGQGETVIDGSNLARIFYLSNGVTSFTLKDITIKNAYATQGSVVYFVDRMSNVKIKGTFTDNKQQSNGIFTFSNGVSGNVELDGTYTNNYATSGNVGVVNFETIYSGSTVNLKGTYKNNSAKSEIGVAYFPTVEEGASVVLSGNFMDNTVGGNPNGAASVAYFRYLNGNATLNGTFINNHAVTSGGIIYINNEMNGNLVLSGTFKDNNASNNGGLISISPIVNGNIRLNGTFDNNSAGSNGGIIYFSNVINGNVVLDGIFTNGNATNGAVAYMNNAVNGNVYVNGTYTDNEGFALVSLKDAVTFSNVHVNSGVAGVGVRTSISATLPNSIYAGGKLHVVVSLSGIYDTIWEKRYEGIPIILTVNNKEYSANLNKTGKCEFIIDDLNTPGKYLVNVSYAGDETYLSCDKSYNITVSVNDNVKSFTELYEDINGNINEMVTLSGTYAFNLDTDSDLQNGIPVYRNIVIDGQGSTIDGAGLARVFSVDSKVTDFTLKDVTVKNAYGRGAVVRLNGAVENFELTNVNFVNNTAASYGIVCFDSTVDGNVQISGTFVNNTATYGTVAFFNNDVNGKVTFDGDYVNNNASYEGGVAYFKNVNENIVFNGNYINNSGRQGGVIYANVLSSGVTAELKGTFNNNSATTSGGVISVNSISLGTVLLNGIFTSNNAAVSGGVANFNNQIGTVTMKGVFTSNSAVVNGGVLNIPSTADNLVVDSSSFENNSADVGSVFKLNDILSISIVNSDFITNKANSWTISTNTAINVDDSVKDTYNFGGFISKIVLPTSISMSFTPGTTVAEGTNIRVDVTLNGLKSYNKEVIKVYMNDELYTSLVVDNTGKSNFTISGDLKGDLYTFDAFYDGVENTYSPSNCSANLVVTATPSESGTTTSGLTFMDLKELIDAANAGSTVELEGNYTFDPVLDAEIASYYGGIPIWKTVKIDGMGYTIDGAGRTRIFNVHDGTSFELINVTVKNAYSNSDGGGVVFIADGINIKNVLLNGTFINNYASGNGGGVIYAGQDANGVKITLDGVYSKNSASYGGVIRTRVSSNNYGNLYLNGVYTENSATTNGGVFAYQRTAYSQNVYLNGNFTDNKAPNGAVIYASTGLNIVEAKGNFTRNTVTSNGAVIYLGTHIQDYVILNGNFTNNTATSKGAIAVIGNDNLYSATVTQSGMVSVIGNFTGNIAGDSLIWTNPQMLHKNVIIEDSAFVKNAVSSGYLIVLNNVTSGEIKNNTFDGNKVDPNALILLNTDNVNVKNNTFTSNIVETVHIISIGHNSFDEDNVCDGVLVSIPTTLTLSLSSDSAPSNRNVRVTVTLTGRDNYEGVTVDLIPNPGSSISIPLDSEGVGEYVISDWDPRVYSLVASYSGDAVYAAANSSSNILKILSPITAYNFTKLQEDIINKNNDGVILLDGNYTFDADCDADLINGIPLTNILSDTTDIVIDGQGSTVIDGNGLARVFLINSNFNSFTLKNITVKNAYAQDGAVIYISNNNNNNGHVYLNGTFINNKADRYAGVLYFGSNSLISNTVDCLVVLDGYYYKNSASSWGGGVLFTRGATVTLAGTFEKNSATNGGVYGLSRGGAIVKISATGRFIDNSATTAGGVVYTGQRIQDSEFSGTFIGNTAGGSGDAGVLFVGQGIDSGEVVFSGNFENNTAKNRGSVATFGTLNTAIDSSGGIVVSGTFTNNVAADSLIWTTSSKNLDHVVVENATFTNNTATSGSLINLNNVKNATLNNTNFTGSYVGGSGSVISVNGGNATVSGVQLNDTVGNGITLASNSTSLSDVSIDQVNRGDGIVVNNDNADLANITVSNVDQYHSAVDVNSNNVTIANASVSNSGTGININGDGAKISGSNITNNGNGIRSNGVKTNITGNSIANNTQAVIVNGGNASVSDNNLTNNTNAVIIKGNDTNVTGNKLDGNDVDVDIDSDSNMNDPGKIENIKKDNTGEGDIIAGTSPNLEIANYNSTMINITFMPGVSGELNISLSNSTFNETFNYTIDSNSGMFIFNVPGTLYPGDYDVSVNYGGDDSYVPATVGGIVLTIPKWDVSSFTVSGDIIFCGDKANVGVILPADATGIVLITVDGVDYQADVVGGIADLDISGLAAGDYNVTVRYSGDNHYNEITNYTQITVNKINTDLTFQKSSKNNKLNILPYNYLSSQKNYENHE